ncbi:MAG: hypothetical protein P8Z31_07410 [Gammaproteobacteria bacterium]|jgi:hypothetical protein
MKRLLVILLLILFLLLLGRYCGRAPEIAISPDWTYTPANEKPLARFVPLADGKLLAATPDGEVIAIDDAGNETLLVPAVPSEYRPRVIFNATGDSFGILRGANFEHYDPQGTKISEIPFQAGTFKLVPASRKIYSPEVREFGEDNRKVLNARILDSHGAVQATWPAPGLEVSRLTNQHLVYATSEELVKTTLTGAELWRVPIRVRKLRVSRDASHSIVNSAYDSGMIHTYKEETELGSDDLGGPVWNIAISPDGRYAAASTQTVLHIYADGTRVAAIDPGLEYAVSIAVNNKGEVLVGGQKSGHAAHVALYDRNGAMLWEESSGTDDSAWRPEVRFAPSGDRYLVRHKDRLTSYSIERAP